MLLILSLISFSLVTKDGCNIISSMVNIVMEIIAVVLSRVSNVSSTIEHRPVILDTFYLASFCSPSAVRSKVLLFQAVYCYNYAVHILVLYLSLMKLGLSLHALPSQSSSPTGCEVLALPRHLQFGIELCDCLMNAI